MSMTTPHSTLVSYLRQLTTRFDIPDNARRITLNLRVSSY